MAKCKDYLDIRDAKAMHLRGLKNLRWIRRKELILYPSLWKAWRKEISDISWKIIEIIGQDLDSYYFKYIYEHDEELHRMLKS